jgi:hypothetical protein
MSNLFRTIAAAALLAAIGLTSASAVYAEQSPPADTRDSPMGTETPHGVMGRHSGMMGQMSQMMEGCNSMMQRQNQAPNSQFHKRAQPSQKG